MAARTPLLASIVAILLALAGAVPGSAEPLTTPFHAAYPDELTTPRACPPATPPNAFCYTGVGHGPTTPPGSTGTENFAGFVDQNRADPTTHCAPDFNVVAISTAKGTLFLTTNGNACPISATASVDNGTWQAFGGTGIFKGARGSGTVSTAGTFNANGTISSSSTYEGSLTLR
jgi:hypothetical protein